MAEAVSRCPLPDGKIYHFNVIYNHARSPLSVTPDTELSRAFTEKVVATLESLGYVNCYFHDRDCLPGRNVFTELFRVVEGSDYTIVVLTAGFVNDCWSRYTQQSTFKKLLDHGRTYKFLPLSVALRESDLPQELTTEHVLCFGENWESDISAWNRLSRVFTENIPVPEVTRGQDLPSIEPIQETNAPDGQVSFSGRDDLDHASELPEPQGEGQLGSLVNQNQSLGNIELPVGRSHLANVNESNSETTWVTDETDSGRTDRVDETTDRVREEKTRCGNAAQRESLGGPSNAQSYTDQDQDEHQSRDHPVNEVDQDGSVGVPNTERQNIGRENIESQDIGSQNTERQSIENQDAASQNIESKNTESQNIESQNTGCHDIGNQTAELQSIESQITEIQNTENQITNSQITEGISMDLSRRHLIGSNLEQQGSAGLGKTSEACPGQGKGTGGHSTSIQDQGTTSRKGNWEMGAQNISSLSLPNTSLEEDQGDLESSIVTRLERTGMAGFRDDLVQTRRRSTDDTSSTEKRFKEGRYRYSVDVTPSSHSSFQKQVMEKYVHDVDQTKLKLPEDETQKDSSDQRQAPAPAPAPAPADQDVFSRGKSSTGGIKGISDVSHKQPVYHQTITDQTRHQIGNTSTMRQHDTKVDEASELEAVLFRESLPSLDDSGISESWSNEARTDSESLQDSSPEDTFSGGNSFRQSMLTSWERGTPDGSVQEMKITELKENVDKPEADVELPCNAAYYNDGEPTTNMATSGLKGSNQDDLSPANVSGHDISFVDQTNSLEVLNASGRTLTDTRSLLKKQSVTDTISLTNDALELFSTSQTSAPTGSEETASRHTVTLFDDKSQDHLKSLQTNTESVQKHDLLDKTSKECPPQQDSREVYSCQDTVSAVSEKLSTMQGTNTSFASVKEVEHSTSSIASGQKRKGSGACALNDTSANAASESRHRLWLLPACKLIIHLLTRAENPFLV